jgi:hypothetical protein
MSRHWDIVGVLVAVVVGMFIPFTGSVLLLYGTSLDHLLLGFLVFLVLFGLELGAVVVYFKVSGKRAAAEVERLRPKQ